jgi:predicted DCC family thiol-disulfide oxidoreductase YuxK
VTGDVDTGDTDAGEPPASDASAGADEEDPVPLPDDGPVLLFDGVCNLCNGVVQWLVPRDPEGRIRYAPLQSDVGARLLGRCGLPDDQLESVVLVEGGDCYTKSEAALRVASHLETPARHLALFRVVPRVLRDAVYDLVADYRYRVFGRRDQCMVPTPDLRDRFLETN